METSKKKRILIFSHTYFPFVGGAEVAIREITDRINPGEFEFDLIALGYRKGLPRVEKMGNITLYRIGFFGKCEDIKKTTQFPLYLNKFLMPALGTLKALSLHRKNKYDIVWTVIASYNSFAALIFKKLKPEVKMVLTLQEGDPIDYIKKKTRFVKPFFKSIFSAADIVQVISNYLAEFAKEMGVRNEIIVVPNGVDINKFNIRDESKIQEIKKRFNKGDDFWVITTSRLVKKNAIDDVIIALKELPDNVKFLILGEGPLEEDLKDKVVELNLEDRVLFLGYVEYSELSSYIHASDVFVRPSLSEGFGNSFIEAMAAQIPVIATDVGGIRDFLKHKETGLVCGENDPDDIAHKIFVIMKDDILRDYIVENAFKMVNEKYDWNMVSEQMRAVFKKVDFN